MVRIERGGIADFGRRPFIHFREQRRERPQRMNPGLVFRQSFAQIQRLAILSRRLQQRGAFHGQFFAWISGRECSSRSALASSKR